MYGSSKQVDLVRLAFAEIEQLFSNYDFFGQIESARPLLSRHRRTLAKLNNALRSGHEATQRASDERWLDDLVTVYREFGGQALDADIYRRMRQLRQGAGRSWPRHARSVIRQTRKAHNVESSQYRGAPDFFRMVHRGLWRLK